MAQVRRRTHYRSPPARQIPSLPNPIRFEPPTPRRILPIQTQNGQFDPVSGLIIPGNNSEQSQLSLTSSSNHEKQQQEQQRILEESIILPQLSDEDELLEKKYLPVYAQFPFDISVSIVRKIARLFFLLIKTKKERSYFDGNHQLRRQHIQLQ